MPLRAVFLDRDGVINAKAPEGDYVKAWQEFMFLPGVKGAIRALNQNGFTPMITSNQRGIARGCLTEEDLAEIHRRMLAALEAEGASVSAIYHCPHDVGVCPCRKPQTGLFLRAQRDFPGLDFSQACGVGDSEVDMEAAETLGAKKVLILRPDADVLSLLLERNIHVDFVARSLFEAATEYFLAGCRSGAQVVSRTLAPFDRHPGQDCTHPSG
jgi:D-glycero-D-manno-heptose 1,7-bisphosphate phosphatase